MSTKQGDVGLLREPLAQELLQSKGPAHLAYTWRDGTPRVVPIGFHWNGEELVMATATDAPKTKVLTDGSKVAVSIDSDFAASKILLIRGTARLSVRSNEAKLAHKRGSGSPYLVCDHGQPEPEKLHVACSGKGHEMGSVIARQRIVDFHE